MNSLTFAPQDEQETRLLLKDILLYHDTRDKPLKLPVSIYGIETITSTPFSFFSERKVYKVLRQVCQMLLGSV